MRRAYKGWPTGRDVAAPELADFAGYRVAREYEEIERRIVDVKRFAERELER